MLHQFQDCSSLHCAAESEDSGLRSLTTLSGNIYETFGADDVHFIQLRDVDSYTQTILT
jgi:hypothetical protein